MGATVYIGLCVTAHNNSAVSAATFDSVTWTGSASFAVAGLGPDVRLLVASVFDGPHATFAGVYVQVVDGHVISRGTVTVTVGGSNPTTGVGNHPAAFRSVRSNLVSVAPGQNVQLTADAFDVEGNTLDYGWAPASGGTITGTGPTVTWTAPAAGSGRPAKAGLWIWPGSRSSGAPRPRTSATRGCRRGLQTGRCIRRGRTAS